MNATEQWLPLVRIVARKIASRHPRGRDVFDDLIAYGCIGLAAALDDFDPRRGVRFESYAAQRIRWSMIDGMKSWRYVKNPHQFPKGPPRFGSIEDANRVGVQGGQSQVETLDAVEVLMKRLDSRSRDVVWRSIKGELHREIGADIGLGRQRVDQIYNQAMEIMREEESPKPRLRV